MHFFVKYFLMFLFFSSAGWLIESLYCSIGPMVSGKVKKFKFINRGFLTGPLTPHLRCQLHGHGGHTASV